MRYNSARKQHRMLWPFLLLLLSVVALVQQKGLLQEYGYAPSYSMPYFSRENNAPSLSGPAFTRVVVLESHDPPAERRLIIQDESLDSTQAPTADLNMEQGQDECLPKPWQTVLKPTCNDMHSLSMGDALYEAARSHHNRPPKGLFEFFGHGGNRLAGKLALEDEVVVYKTGRYKLEYKHKTFGYNRKEAAAMDMLKGASIDMYGVCGMVSVSELADGGTMRRFRNDELNDGGTMQRFKNDEGLEPLTLLNHAIDLSRAVAKLHSIDEDYVSLIHRDLDTSNVVFVDDKPKIIDFHASLLIPWNKTDNRPCLPYISASTKRADSVPPEMWADNYLSEKVDVYSLGALLFYMLTKGARLYHCEQPKGICDFRDEGRTTLPESEVKALKLNGTLPQFPKDIENSTDPAIEAIRDVIKRAVCRDPEKRPSASDIVKHLERVQETLRTTKVTLS